MLKIGLLSDTHGSLPMAVSGFFRDCSEIWHAGDVGNIGVLDRLASLTKVRAVYGNVDGSEVRSEHPEILCFRVEDLEVVMMHIGGYPGNYSRKALEQIRSVKPGLFVSGHSHILKVIYDKKHQLLHLNPGAAGKEGWHKKITLLRFDIEGKEIRNLEINELPRSTAAWI